MSTDNASQKFFDLTTDGMGYLNRVRLVEPNKGPSYLAADITAIFGSADDVQRTRFQTIVVGTDAKKIIQTLKTDVDDRKAVLCGFRLGDLSPELFTYKSGDKQGESGIALKTRLLKIKWVKVDGESVDLTPIVDEAPAQAAS